MKRSRRSSVSPKIQGSRYCGEFIETCLSIYDALPIERRDSQRELLASMAEIMETSYAKQERTRNDEAEGIEVDKDLKEAEYFIGQAPVGTGKTYVLLLLAFVSFWLYGKKTVISTQTKVLQNQLLKKDIPVFKKLLGKIAGTNGIVDNDVLIQWTSHLVKGRDNYLCPNIVSKYMDETRDGQDMLVIDADGNETVISYSQLLRINGGDSAFGDGRTDSFDMDRNGQIGNWSESVLDLLSTCAENCDSSGCEHFPRRCPYYNAKFQNSALIICNHNIIKSLLRPNPIEPEVISSEETNTENLNVPSEATTDAVEDVKLPLEEEEKKKMISPISLADNYFFDEAHHFMGYYCGKRIKQELTLEGVHALIYAPIFCFVSDRSLDEMKRIEAKQKEMWKQWKKICSLGEKLNTKDTFGVNYRLNDLCSEIDVLLNMCEELKDLYGKFSAVKSRIGLYKVEILKSKLLDMQKNMKETPLEDYIGVSENSSDEKNEKKVFIHTSEGYESVVFQTSNLSDDLEDNFKNAAFVGFISGTLLVDGKDDVFRSECGLPKCHVVQVASPFEHKNITLWVPKADAELPYPINQKGKTQRERDAWQRWANINKDKRKTFLVNFCKRYIPKYIQRDLGGVLILCTSNETKSLIAESIRHDIQKVPNRFLYEQGEMPRVRLVQNFMNSKSPVLVATNSFREGFDAIGDKLTWVILDRLPYSNPLNRELQERLNILLRDSKITNKREHVSTLMFFSLIQSLGRLERTVSDWGMMTILDPRFYWLCQEGIDNRLAIFSHEFRKAAEEIFKPEKDKIPPIEFEWLPRKEYLFQKNTAQKQQRRLSDFMSAIGAMPEEEKEIIKSRRDRMLKRQLEIPYFWENTSNFITNKPIPDEIYRITESVRNDARREAYLESYRKNPAFILEPLPPVEEVADVTCV